MFELTFSKEDQSVYFYFDGCDSFKFFVLTVISLKLKFFSSLKW